MKTPVWLGYASNTYNPEDIEIWQQEFMERFAQGLAGTQALSVFLDGIARHTPEGYEFQAGAARDGYRQAVRDRDEPFGDHGLGSPPAD